MIDGNCILTVTRSKLIKYRGPFKALDGITAKEFLLSMIGKNTAYPHDIRFTIRLNFKQSTAYQLKEDSLKINSMNHVRPDPDAIGPLADNGKSERKLQLPITTDHGPGLPDRLICKICKTDLDWDEDTLMYYCPEMDCKLYGERQINTKPIEE